MKVIQDFTSPEYIHALTTSIKYGLMVVGAMLVAGAVMTLAGGGLSAMWWKKPESGGHAH